MEQVREIVLGYVRASQESESVTELAQLAHGAASGRKSNVVRRLCLADASGRRAHCLLYGSRCVRNGQWYGHTASERVGSRSSAAKKRRQ